MISHSAMHVKLGWHLRHYCLESLHWKNKKVQGGHKDLCQTRRWTVLAYTSIIFNAAMFWAPQIFGACSDRIFKSFLCHGEDFEIRFECLGVGECPQATWRRARGLWSVLEGLWQELRFHWETGPGGSGRCTAGLRVSLSVMVMGGWWSH